MQHMVNVQTEIVINRPIKEVATYAQNPETATEWYQNIVSSRLMSSRPIRVGSEIAFEAKFLGKKLSYTYKVVELNPNKKLVMRTSDGPFAMETTYYWKEIDQDTTKMMLRNCGNPSGFSKFMKPFMSMMMKKENKKDLERIKDILENS